MTEAYTAVIDDFGSAVYAQLTRATPKGKKAEPWGGFDAWAEEVRAWIKAVTASKVKDITEYTMRLLKEQIEEGMAAGEAIDQLRLRVDEVMDFCGMVRATRIARTEVIAASNAGSFFGAKQTGLALDKEWLATQDARTRDTHSWADGQRRKLNEPFDVGGAKMDFPGDSRYGAPAREIVNCRCTLAYIEAEARPQYYVDVPDLPEQGRRGLAESWQQVLDHGRRTGNEALAVISADTGQPLYPLVAGQKSAVYFPKELVQLIEQSPADSIAIAHNHPSSGSFSAEDLQWLRYPSVKYMSAIGHDGTRYLVSRSKAAKLENLTYENVKRTWQDAVNRYFNEFRDKVLRGEMTEQEAWKEHSHLALQRVAIALRLNYRRALPNE